MHGQGAIGNTGLHPAPDATRRVFQDLTESLRVVESGRPALESVTAIVSEAFRAPLTAAFRASYALDGGWSLDYFHTGGEIGKDVARTYPEYLRGAPHVYLAYDPLRPAASERNRVRSGPTVQAALGLDEENLPHVIDGYYRPKGLDRIPQLRVLVCDGPLLLTWFGLWREEPIGPEEVNFVTSLVEPLKTRLRTERMLRGAIGSVEHVAVALEAIGAPAFFVRSNGVIELANEVGLTLLAADRVGALARIRAAIQTPERCPDADVNILTSAGQAPLALVVLRQDPDAHGKRVAECAQRWQLTAREAEVLAFVVRGDENKDIATKLLCSPRTVEIHVSHILRKARVERRAGLATVFWRGCRG